MNKLESWFSPQATKTIMDYDPGREIWLEQVNTTLFATSFVKVPSKFEDNQL